MIIPGWTYKYFAGLSNRSSSPKYGLPKWIYTCWPEAIWPKMVLTSQCFLAPSKPSSFPCGYLLLMLTVLLLLLLLSHFSRVRLCAGPHRRQPTRLPSLGFSRQEYCSGSSVPSLDKHSISRQRKVGKGSNLLNPKNLLFIVLALP